MTPVWVGSELYNDIHSKNIYFIFQQIIDIAHYLITKIYNYIALKVKLVIYKFLSAII